MGKADKNAIKEYGERVRAYRKAANISQEVLANLAEVHQPYIASIEKGDVNIGILTQETISSTFGVKYYELSDPGFPIPSKDILRENIKTYIASRNIDPTYLKDEVQNFATYMDELLKSDFLVQERSGKEIAQKYKELYGLDISPTRISDMLSREPRKSIVDVIKPEKGRQNKYKLKS